MRHLLSKCYILVAAAMWLTSCGNENDVPVFDYPGQYPVMIPEGENFLTVDAQGGNAEVILNEGTVSVLSVITDTDLFSSETKRLLQWIPISETLALPALFPTKDLFDCLDAGDVVSDWFVERDMLGSRYIFDMPSATVTREYVKSLSQKGVVLTNVNRGGRQTQDVYEVAYQDWATVSGTISDDGLRKVSVRMKPNTTGAERVLCVCFYGATDSTPLQGPLFEVNNVIRVAQPAQ